MKRFYIYAESYGMVRGVGKPFYSTLEECYKAIEEDKKFSKTKSMK